MVSTQASQRKRVTIKEWLDEVMNDVELGKCTTIAIMLSKGGGAEELRSMKTAGREWTNDIMAQWITNYCQTTIQDIPGTHTFQLFAFYEGDPQPRAKFSFLLSGSLDNNGLGTEAPTPQGMQMQQMRWGEGLIQGMFQERAMLLDMPFRVMHQQNEMIRMLSEMAKTLMGENADAVRLSKEVILEQATRKHEHEMALVDKKQKAADRAQLMKLAPVALNILTGREIVPQSTADSQLIELIAEHMTAENAQKLLESGAIPPQLLGIIMKRLSQALEKKKAEEAAALARGSEADTDADDDPLLPARGETGAKH